MLKLILAIIRIVGAIVGRILERRPPPKPASEHLKDSPTVDAVAEAEAEATKKFGPRP